MSGQTRLLLADDDRRLVSILEERLRRDGYAVTVATKGSEALAAVDRRWPDLIILDLMLPDMRGERVAAEIKRRADLPIIVLSAVSEVSSKTSIIQEFAEDYLTKPFHYPELRARIERVLRRLEDRIPVEEVTVGDGLVLILRRREAIVEGERVKLTPIESRVLATLAASPGRPVTTEQLLARVWADADGADPVYVWVTMRRLRQKLEPDPGTPRFIHTVRGGGYRLGDAAADAPA
ncbi:MAG: response regulator transcription factor [Candidatus Limnocylindrales bacterium]